MQKHAGSMVLATILLVTLGLGLYFWTRDLSRTSSRDTPLLEAHRAAKHFLNEYLAQDGRVIRRDEGGDTVSEGQAYAMLLAAAIEDRRRFDLSWRWAKAHLERRDHLLSWHWDDGRVVDLQPATDADLDAARALLLAAQRFRDRSYERDALRIARSILRKETVTRSGNHILVAGPWARSAPFVINPSYFSPRAFQELHWAADDRRWLAVARAARRIVVSLTDRPTRLPPDWAKLSGSMTSLTPSPSPGSSGADPVYGLDAARVVVRFAEACHSSSRKLAASTWPFLRRARTAGIALAYDLDGTPAASDQHPAGVVAAAAAAHAAGATAASEQLLDQAERLEQRFPSYYGAAWVALGRVMLATGLLGDCSE